MQSGTPSKEQFQTLKPGRRYRVYYVHYPPAHLIMSLEELA